MIMVMRPLSPTFAPGPYDVICGRGKFQEHLGNQVFEKEIETSFESYANATTKTEKSCVVTYIINRTRERTPTGGFVKQYFGDWYEIGNHLAREKIGQRLREQLHTRYKSSTKSKKRRRREELDKLRDKAESFLEENCSDLVQEFKDISLSGNQRSDDELQILFNQTQFEMLKRVKQIVDFPKKKNTNVVLLSGKKNAVEGKGPKVLSKRIENKQQQKKKKRKIK